MSSFILQSFSILAELDGVEWGRTPIYVETFPPYGDVRMSMNGPSRESTSIAAFTPAGLLVLYVLIRILL
jgi:hypothetical protein